MPTVGRSSVATARAAARRHAGEPRRARTSVLSRRDGVAPRRVAACAPISDASRRSRCSRRLAGRARAPSPLRPRTVVPVRDVAAGTVDRARLRLPEHAAARRIGSRADASRRLGRHAADNRDRERPRPGDAPARARAARARSRRCVSARRAPLATGGRDDRRGSGDVARGASRRRSAATQPYERRFQPAATCVATASSRRHRRVSGGSAAAQLVGVAAGPRRIRSPTSPSAPTGAHGRDAPARSAPARIWTASNGERVLVDARRAWRPVTRTFASSATSARSSPRQSTTTTLRRLVSRRARRVLRLVARACRQARRVRARLRRAAQRDRAP